MNTVKDKWLLWACLPLVLLMTTHANAHSPTRAVPRYGGVVELVDKLHVEFVRHPSAVRVYVLDPARTYLPVTLERVSATLMQDDGLDRIDLHQEPDGGWVSKQALDFMNTKRAIVRLDFAEHSQRLIFGPFDTLVASDAAAESHHN